MLNRFRRLVRGKRDRLTCPRAVELVTDYLEDALSAEARARLEAHLRDCSGCRAYLDQMRATIAVMGRVAATRPDPAVQAELVAMYRRFHSV